MRDNLLADLESLFHELVDYRSRLLHHLNLRDLHLADDTRTALDQIRTSLSYVEDRIVEAKADLEQRVYCIQVTTTVEMNIKVLAKNEDDAIEWAIRCADKRIQETLGDAYDADVYTECYNLGDESIHDDEAEEEYPYDE